MKNILITLISLLFLGSVFANTKVVMETNKGKIEIELFDKQAPKTVKNFLSYIEDGFYNGTIFHRVIGDFMIQGGGYTTDLQKKSTKPPITNEAANRIGNETGTIAMARTNDPDSATAQFFINVQDNSSLNYSSPRQPGYAVFGKVTQGMSVVNVIKKSATRANGPFQNLPVENIIIQKAYVKK